MKQQDGGILLLRGKPADIDSHYKHSHRQGLTCGD